MKVLIIGSGGREHALLKKVVVSPKVKKIYCVPGSSALEETAECVFIPPDNIGMLVDFAKHHKIDLTIVGPELPLTKGIVDAFEAEQLKIFGPSRDASQLEGSKVFCKQFCQRHGIPTAGYREFEDFASAKEYLLSGLGYPVVIKTDGLAAGKGVSIVQGPDEGLKIINDMMVYEKFGEAGRRIIVEEFLRGAEASFIVVTDGSRFVSFPAAQDHKAVFDGDVGPNTGGMGAYAPARVFDEKIRQQVIATIIQPTIDGMRKDNKPYVGFLYAGLMILPNGTAKLLEYNCRMGDPEAEVLLPLLKSDFIELIEHALSGKLGGYEPQFESSSAVCVVMASGGYPGHFKKGLRITGLESVVDPLVTVFHSGTKQTGNGYVTVGGRVLTVSALGHDLPAAIDRAYGAVSHISWDGVHYRKDIGKKGM